MKMIAVPAVTNWQCSRTVTEASFKRLARVERLELACLTTEAL